MTTYNQALANDRILRELGGHKNERNCVETLDAATQANGGCEWIASIEARAAIARAEGN
jgi:hypothetical protein